MKGSIVQRKVWRNSMEEQVKKLKEYMDASNNTVAVTGSGISYLSGMRRFKQMAGRANMPRMMSSNYVKKHPDEVYSLFRDAFLYATFDKGPSPVHYQLAELEKRGELQGIVTQNLDHLHTLAGSENVVAFMGDFADSVCIECGEPCHDINVWNQGEMPRCPKCGGYLMPVFFARMGLRSAGDSDSNNWMEQAKDMIAQAGLILVIGTTGFHSDDYLSRMRPSTKIVQINPGSTIFDSMAELNIQMDAEKVFDQILA